MERSSGLLQSLREYRVDLEVLAVLLIWVGSLYHRVLAMWWTADDPMVLWHVFRFGPADYFLDPAAWRSFNAASLTPWMPLSFDVDLSICGLAPGGFYVHQLIAVAAAACALYFCLRLYLSVGPAAAGGFGLVASPAVAEICGFLAARHYPEGLVFACISFAAFVFSIRRRKWWLAALGGVFYALALTAKEIYAPLVLILVALPEGNFRERLKRIALFVPVVIGYVGWRWWMLGGVVGGYRDRPLPTGGELAAWARGFMGGTGVPPVVPILIAVALISVSGALLFRCSPHWRAFWVVFAVCAVAPVVPVLHVYSPRHAFGPTILLSAVAAALVQIATQWSTSAGHRRMVALACALTIAVAGVSARAQLPSSELAQRIRAEGEEVLTGENPQVVVVSPVMPYWHFFGLLQLRGEVLELGRGPGVVTGICFAELGSGVIAGQHRRNLVFDPGAGRLVPLRNGAECRIDDEASLSVMIRFESGTTSWRLGPYSTGRYTVLWAISDNSLIGIDVPPTGNQRGNIAFEMGVDMVVAYQSPDGWMTTSPRLAAEPRAGGLGVGWSR